MSWDLMLIASIVTAYSILLYVGRKREKKIWNNGRCAECHCIWRSFDVASDMSVGYKCAGCGHKNSWWANFKHEELE